MWTPEAVITNGPSVQTYGKINMPQYYNECNNCERIQPDLLNAFRSNPFTHSLTSAV
jgi:predicted nucleic acid-binding Zn ribbon protein